MKNKFLPIIGAAMLFLGASCKKQEITIPPPFAGFPNEDILYYYVQNNPNSQLKVPVGASDISNVDRSITFTVSSPTGATEGVQYSLPGKTLTIPAGEAIDSFIVKGVYDQIPLGRVDTLVFTITGGDLPPSTYANQTKVVMQRYCDVVLSDFTGLYANTKDGAYGPYPTAVMSVAPVDATSGKIVVRNVYDYGFDDLEFTLNWVDPGNFRVSLLPQNTGADASVRFGATYAGNPLWIYPVPGTDGTFSSCYGTLKLVYRLGIPGVGFGPAEETDMAR